MLTKPWDVEIGFKHPVLIVPEWWWQTDRDRERAERCTLPGTHDHTS